MNNVIIIGRLTRDPELRRPQGEKETIICRYSLAVPRGGRDSETDFINIVSFGKTAEFAEKYFRKGIRVAVQGQIRTGSFKGKDGNTVKTFEIMVNNQEFADGKQEAQPVQTAPAKEQETFEPIATEDIDEDMPF